MKVFLSELADLKLTELCQYLLEEWSLKTRDKFISKLNDKITQISNQPESCPKSLRFKELYRCVVTKHTTLYYRILKKSNEVEIITIFDTRQNPDKIQQDFK
ncbi:MAG: type II toxin-antitoxin system RelE/ParE family toxin [Bacteroidetes bacterium]|jgi:plasmid stabilization system protein ParE|nr:type II toxin-antitoxin system RelE/ParE family toxin [Bacteroidota bacterium]